MEDKREFNDILIDDRAQYQNRSKKIMLLVVAAAVLLIILLVSAIAMSGTDEKSQSQQVAQENGLQPQGQTSENATEVPNVEFEPVQTADAAANDRFEQIVKQIQDRHTPQNTQNTEVKPESTPTPAPILETASQNTTSTPVVAQPTQPTQPQATSKPTPVAQLTQPTQPRQTQAPKPESTPTPTTPQPQRPQATPKPTQTSQPTPVAQPTQPTQPERQPQIAQNTQPVPTTQPRGQSSIDKSKNGQVAQKGHYIQVGSFENTPNKEFLNKLNNYSYRVYGAQNSTKYLIGPYDSRTDANRDMLKVKTDMGDQVFYYEVK
ncbi:SPOR domain-containing protein [uncultured Helicobacter sp.]|uniref:SPOR domain-containing protein n=1 Tax=uncultured Helicobacter sp. TaxID=175537 RepID=UPI00374ECFE4